MQADVTTSTGAMQAAASTAAELMSTNVVTAAQDAWHTAATAMETLNKDGSGPTHASVGQSGRGEGR
jgi:hypothetical protein